jgi:hypothetical protein
MKKIFSAFWKILLLTVVFFIGNAVMGVVLPLSNDMMAAMTPEDQAIFTPLFLLNTFITMTVIYLLLTHMRYKGWRLFLAGWVAWMEDWLILRGLSAILLLLWFFYPNFP